MENMSIATIAHGRQIALTGRLDARGATPVRAALHAAVLDGTGDLVVDMSGVESLDAVGLGVLVGTRRLASGHGRTLVLRQCSPQVARRLRSTRLHRTFTLETSDGAGGRLTRRR